MGRRKVTHKVAEPPPKPLRPKLIRRRRYVFVYNKRKLTGKLVRVDKGGWATMEDEFLFYRVRTTAVEREAITT